MNDQELVQRCRNDDRKAQNLLFSKYEKKVLTISRRYSASLDEAKDVQQDSFIKIFQSLKSGTSEIESLDKWINRVSINVAIDHCRKQRRLDDVHHSIKVTESTEPIILEKLEEEELIAIIQEIPNPYRSVFNLFVVEGYSHKEIGEALQVGESTSRSYLTRAKDFLRDRLAQSKSIHKGYG